MKAEDALERLIEGNRRYVSGEMNTADVSVEARERTVREGQSPYAAIVSCSDSRVIPEAIFSAGIGELFVIRVAGNVIGPFELGSAEYAVDHLGTRLVVVLGHTHCGAVGAALSGHAEGAVAAIVNGIKAAIGDERDENAACRLNALFGARTVREGLSAFTECGLKVLAAVYDTASGKVVFLND